MTERKDFDEKENASISGSNAPKLMKKVFGVFMLAIYLGMGYLTFSGYFDILFGDWQWMKIALGSLFTFYGIWRAYRYFTGRN